MRHLLTIMIGVCTMAKSKLSPGKRMIGSISLFVGSGFFLLALKDMSVQSMVMAFVVPLIFLASSTDRKSVV